MTNNILTPAQIMAEVLVKYGNLTDTANGTGIQKSTLYEMRSYAGGKRVKMKNLQRKFEQLASALGYDVIPAKQAVQVFVKQKNN